MADLRGVGASGGDVRDSVVGAIGDSDVTSVLDAVGCQRVVVFGTGLGGPAAIRYATHHPERVQALVLVDTFAYLVREDDYPWGLPPESLERRADALADMWGTGAAADVVSETVKGHLVGSDMAFSERGTHVLKGVPDRWRLYAIEC